MARSFNFTVPPFDVLTAEQQQWVRNSIDMAYYPEDSVVLASNTVPTHLYVVVKGRVRQSEQEEEVYLYGPDEAFDGRALMAGKVVGRFVAVEEAIVYLLPEVTVKRLIAANVSFGALLFSDISQKLRALSERRTQRELHSLMLSRIDQAYVRTPVYVHEDRSVFHVAQTLEQEQLNHVLVEGAAPGRLGIFTTTDIRKIILSGEDPKQTSVGQLTSWELIEVQAGESVFEALILMIRHGVHRVVVKRDQAVVGVLEQLDLLSFISNHSHLIWYQIQQANTVDELKHACQQIQRLIQLLSESEVKVSLIAKLVQELNAKVFGRLWRLLAPTELIENSCVMVMGSEGRGEQLLKTDQDNGLILRNGYHYPELIAITSQFNDALCDFGYPPCPGGIMMRNPIWCQTLESFQETLRQWIYHPTPETPIRLAIFTDAAAVCGDRGLLEDLKQYFRDILQQSPQFLAQFARAVDQFGGSGRWWSRLLPGADSPEVIDIKKLGIFPIVHGVRSLALEAKLTVNGTRERLEALEQSQRLPHDLVQDLHEALAFLMDMRLRQGLRMMALGQRPSHLIELNPLSTLERDLLRDSLQVVKRFKQLLHFHFRLDTL